MGQRVESRCCKLGQVGETSRHLSIDLHLNPVATHKRYRSPNVSFCCLIFKTVIISVSPGYGKE